MKGNKMKRTIGRVLIITFFVVLTVGAIGCVAASKLVTPGKMDKGAIDYVVGAGVATPEDFKPVLYANLYMVEELDRKVEVAHAVINNGFQQLIDADNFKYAVVKQDAYHNLEKARKLEDQIFGKTGLLTTGLAAMGIPLAGLVGLLRKRPQDFTKDDVEGIRTEIEASGIISKKALAETVGAIEKFKGIATKDNWETLKDKLHMEQSIDTKDFIKRIKAV